MRGGERPLPGAIDLAIYRIAQEALTNVRKHAAGVTRVDVDLRYTADAVELLVGDDGDGMPEGDGEGGYGLIGMRERAGMHDGTLEAGPRDGGGFAGAGRPAHRVGAGGGVSIRIFLVDDQALVRAGFRMLIEAQPDMDVVGEAADGRAALEALAVTTADVVLMDVRMPGLDGVEATERLLAGGRAGAEGHRPHHLRPRRVRLRRHPRGGERVPAQGRAPRGAARAVRSVVRGDAVVAPSATRRLLDQLAGALPAGAGRRDDPRLELLTPREREVLLEVARGRSNAEIAGELFMAEATVKTHVGRLLSKLELRDRVQLVVLAYDTGLVRPAG